MKLTFNKEGTEWYINLPDYPGPKSDLLMVAGADNLLDVLDVNNDNTVIVKAYTEKPQEYNIKLKKLFNVAGGATYFANHSDFKAPVWLCKVTKYVFNKLPRNIYVKT